MRQNSKNNRSRGRGRKGPNPLTRSYESNGPDVKVRGTAQHVAEKYMTLARDALSSGDGVSAENYFQHAEHYNRIIMSAQVQANAAREEERRTAAAASENDEQPSIDSNATGPINGESVQAPEAANDSAAASAAKDKSHADGGPKDGSDEAPKPRRRRQPARPRKSASSNSENGPSAGEQPAAEASDTIAENPPAFLMSD